MEIPQSGGLVRGDCSYTSGCNLTFQGPAARGMKLASIKIGQLERQGAPIHPVLPLHDEIIAEVPIDRAHEMAALLERTMIEEMSSVLPGIPIKVEAALMERWYKGAKPVFRDGRLVPWQPKTTEGPPLLEEW